MSGLNGLQKPVLVLNASYEPINVCAARRAIVLVLKGVAATEERTPFQVSSSRLYYLSLRSGWAIPLGIVSL